MNRPVYWGLGVLIVLFIGAFVFVMVNQHAENKQIEAELKEAQRKLDAHNKTANTPEVVEISDEKPPDEPGFVWVRHDDYWDKVPIAEVPNAPDDSPLTDHASLLKTYPVKALRLQSEARGHWSAEWIPPFPPKNLSKTTHDFLIENPKASVADVKQGNSEYKVQYPVYSYSSIAANSPIGKTFRYHPMRSSFGLGHSYSDYIIVTEHWMPPLPPTLPIISPIADPFTDSTQKAKPIDICNWLKHYIKLTKTYHRFMERCLTI